MKDQDHGGHLVKNEQRWGKDAWKSPDRELNWGLLNSLTSLSWGEIFGHGTVFCICTSFGICLVGLTIFCRWALLGASCPCVSVCQLNCSTVKSVVGLNSRPDKRLRQQNNFAATAKAYRDISWHKTTSPWHRNSHWEKQDSFRMEAQKTEEA